MKIIVEYWPPPIPQRDFDWCAVGDNYDADCDQNGYFSTCAIGHGKTLRGAINDLLDRMEVD